MTAVLLSVISLSISGARINTLENVYVHKTLCLRNDHKRDLISAGQVEVVSVKSSINSVRWVLLRPKLIRI